MYVLCFCFYLIKAKRIEVKRYIKTIGILLVDELYLSHFGLLLPKAHMVKYVISSFSHLVIQDILKGEEEDEIKRIKICSNDGDSDEAASICIWQTQIIW